MKKAGPADRLNQLTEPTNTKTRRRLLSLFLIVAAVTIVLRIFYSGHLYEDEGLWFTAAEEIIRGKALYGEIYFDKPPGIALVYAFLFWIFGAHVLTIRLFTILYSIAMSAILYVFGSRLYDTRIGSLAALMFAVFSTTYTTGHVQGFGTDFLMALPYTAGAFLLIESGFLFEPVNRSRLSRTLLALMGGVLVGIAFQINPKAILDLVFFACFLIAAIWWRRWFQTAGTDSIRTGKNYPEIFQSLKLFALAVVGLVIGSLPFLSYVAATHSRAEYWKYVWDWGARYLRYNSASTAATTGFTRTIDYFTANNTLLIALVFLGTITARRVFLSVKQTKEESASALNLTRESAFQPDAVLLLWFFISYLGVILGGRLYGHYFFQILPALCLIGARGLTGIRSSLEKRDRALRRAVGMIITIGFAFTLVRYHGRTVILATDLLRGGKGEATQGWLHERINREERMVAAAVCELSDEENSLDRFSISQIRAGGPRFRKAGGPDDYLFVWGYRPEVYYFSGLLPASRFLSTQPLTGVPSDAHYFHVYHSVLDETETSSNRARLLQELKEIKPKYIIDELGMFNAELSINRYPELAEFMQEYKATGAVERFMVYCRRDLLKKNLRRAPLRSSASPAEER